MFNPFSQPLVGEAKHAGQGLCPQTQLEVCLANPVSKSIEADSKDDSSYFYLLSTW